MANYIIPASETQTEITVVNSRFIASISPAFSVERAREFIQKIRHQYPDATHHVSAYLIGCGNNVNAHCTDDGEPAGTAGRPVLAVLQGSGLGDVVAVVTRYFGGTKLGTGGLVRAYGDAIKEGLKNMSRAKKIATHTVLLVCSYPLYERVKLSIGHANGLILDSEFGVDVSLTVQIAIEYYDRLKKDLDELSAGTIEMQIIETDPNTIFPLA